MESPAEYVVNVPATQIPLVKKDSPIPNIDFETPSKDYWRNKFPECFESYTIGDMAGKFSKNDLSLTTFFEKLNALIRETSIIALGKKSQTSEQIKDALELIKLNLKILSCIIKEDNLSEENVRSLYSFMQGFVNSTISIQKGRKNEN